MEKKKSFLSENFYIFTTLYTVGVFLSNDMFFPAISSVANDLHTTIDSVQLTVTSWLAGAMLVQLFAGPVSDSYGRKNVILICGVFTMLGSFGCTFTDDVTIFMVSRFFEGFAAGAVGTAAISSIIDYYDSKKVILVMSGLTNFMVLAPVAGPLIGAYILTSLDWRHIFIIDNIMFFLATVALAVYMPETLRDENKAEWHGIFTPVKLIYRVSKDIPFLIYCISGGCASFIYALWITGSPVVLITNNGLSATDYAIYQAPVLFTFIAGNIVIAQVSKKASLKTILDYSHILFLIVGLLAVISGVILQISLMNMLIGLAVIFFVYGLLNAPKNNYALLLPEKYIGTASTFYSLTAYGSSMLASVYAITLSGKPDSTMLTVCGAFAVFAFITAFITEFMLKRRKISTEAGEAGSIAEHEEWLRRQHNYSVHTGDDNYDNHDHSTN